MKSTTGAAVLLGIMIGALAARAPFPERIAPTDPRPPESREAACLPTALYWLYLAEEQEGTPASQALPQVASRLADPTMLSPAARRQIVKNMERARRFGLFTPEGLPGMLRGGRQCARRGKYTGQPLAIVSPASAAGGAGGTPWETLELVPAAFAADPAAFAREETPSGIVPPARPAAIRPLPPSAIYPERLLSPRPIVPDRSSSSGAVFPKPGSKYETVRAKLREVIDLRNWGVKDWDLQVREKNALEIRGATISQEQTISVPYYGPPPYHDKRYKSSYDIRPFAVPTLSAAVLPDGVSKGYFLCAFPELRVYLLEQPLSTGENIQLLFEFAHPLPAGVHHFKYSPTKHTP